MITENKTHKIIELILTYVCFGVALFGIGTMFRWCFSSSIWTDEAFTLAIIKHPYLDMTVLTANDVHPPLYYLVVKSFVLIMGVIAPGMSVITAAKMCSVIIEVVFLFFIIRIIGREFGALVSGLFAASMMGFVNIMEYGIEIRMYAIAIMFVTLAYAEIHAVLRLTKSVKNTSSDDIWREKRALKNAWICFTLFSFLGAYCQLFACLAIGMLYLCFMVWIYAFSGEDKKQLISSFWKSVAFMVVTFLPWLIVVIRQFLMLQEDYWIDPITRYDIPKYLEYLFPSLLLVTLVSVTVIVSLTLTVMKKIPFQEFYFCMTGFIDAMLVIAVGVAVSKILKPIFAIRYIMPAMGALWLGIIILSVMISRQIALKAVVVVVIIYTSIMGIFSFNNTETELKGYADAVVSFTKAHPGAIYIAGKDYLEEDLVTLGGDDVKGYLYKEIPIDVMQAVYDDKLTLINENDVMDVISEAESDDVEVFYIEGGEGTSAAEFADDTGLSLVEIDRFIMEGNAVFYRIDY